MIHLPVPVVGVSNGGSSVASQLCCLVKPCQLPKGFTGIAEAASVRSPRASDALTEQKRRRKL